MRISVIIPTIRADTLAAAITSVRQQSFESWELVVVGQGDEQSLRDVVVRAAEGDRRVRYIHLERRGGSIARNAGIAATTGEIIAFTDDDCEADPEWLAVLDEVFDDSDVGLVGGSLIAPPADRRLGVCPEHVAWDVVHRPDADSVAPDGWGLAGANMAVRRSAQQQVGEFDEYLGAGARFAGSEETDYALRLESLGVTMVSTPRSIVRHTHGHRYGIRAIYRLKRNYARGYGALAAKMTLLADPRGSEWMHTMSEAVMRRPTLRGVASLPSSLLRLWHFRRAYRTCRREYTVDPTDDPVTAVLRPRR